MFLNTEKATRMFYSKYENIRKDLFAVSFFYLVNIILFLYKENILFIQGYKKVEH